MKINRNNGFKEHSVKMRNSLENHYQQILQILSPTWAWTVGLKEKHAVNSSDAVAFLGKRR
jgi:hypothetical protein